MFRRKNIIQACLDHKPLEIDGGWAARTSPSELSRRNGPNCFGPAGRRDVIFAWSLWVEEGANASGSEERTIFFLATKNIYSEWRGLRISPQEKVSNRLHFDL
jgi:hypothetical protein